MLRKAKVFAGVVAAMAISGVAMADTNGMPDGDFGIDAISCGIENDTGGSVSAIRVESQDGANGQSWIQYNSGGAASRQVTIALLPFGAGAATNPLKFIFQSFEPAASPSTNIVTPFGVPFWGGNLTSGQWLGYVANTAGDAPNFCLFTVAP